MKIVIPGGSGQVGQVLKRDFVSAGHDVVIIGRSGVSGSNSDITWDGKTLGAWTGEIDGADVVINMAGRSVNCRYPPKNREAIMRSRVDSTRAVGLAISVAKDVRNRSHLPEDGDGAHPQEPSRSPRKITRVRIRASFPHWPQAVDDLCRRWRENTRRS